MRSATWLRWACWLGLLAFAATVPHAGTTLAQPPKPPAKYWLHMHVEPLSPTLNDQLQLNGEGVVVIHVGPEGPGDKAGIKPNDILLAIGDRALKGPHDLFEVLNASEGKELTVKLLRAGKPTTVTATPTPAPEGDGPHLDHGELSDLRNLERTIRENLKGLKDAGADLRMQIVRPGRMLPPGVEWLLDGKQAFPDDLSVKIEKQGKNPAQLEVKKGDKTWSIKENELAQLPDDVRKSVEGMLGRGPMRLKVLGRDGEIDGPDGGPPRPRRPRGPEDDDGPPPPRRRGGPDGDDGPPPPRRPRGPEGDDGPPPPRRPDGPGGEDGPRSPRRPGEPGPPPRFDDDGDRGPGERGPGDRGPGGEGRRARRPGDGPGPERGPERGPDRARGNLERRLEALNDNMRAIQEQINQLRRSVQQENEREEREERK